MEAAPVPRSILLGLTGLSIGGGMACASRCIARALEDASEAGALGRVDRVLLLDDPERAPAPRAGAQWLARGSKARFVWQFWRALQRHRHSLLLFDYAGLARAMRFLPRVATTDYAVFVHGRHQLARALGGRRATALKRARFLLTNSEFTAKLVREQAPECADRVRVTPLCIDPELLAEWERNAPQQPAPAREPAVLIVGRMLAADPGKGHDALISGWPEVMARVPGAELWVVGEGDDRPRLEARAAALDLRGSVRFLGHVSTAALGDLYRRASVFAMPSSQEGFGLVYAEAMWHGLPCLGSTADAAAYVISEGETGRLVPFADAEATGAALAQMLSDRAGLERMGRTAARVARQRFTYPRFREDLLAALSLT